MFSQLRLRWIYQLSTNEPKVEATPLVAGETIFTTVPPASVIALDAKTGDLIWTYERRLPTKLSVCCGIVNRGLAILGNAVFFGSLDGYLVAINANNGSVIW
jgi:glucose dehydrogenase